MPRSASACLAFFVALTWSFLITSCALSAAEDAVLAKQAADALLDGMTRHVEERVGACQSLAPRTPEMRECLGPIAGNPRETEAFVDALHAAQVRLYIALVAHDDAQTHQALAEIGALLTKGADLLGAR